MPRANSSALLKGLLSIQQVQTVLPFKERRAATFFQQEILPVQHSWPHLRNATASIVQRHGPCRNSSSQSAAMAGGKEIKRGNVFDQQSTSIGLNNKNTNMLMMNRAAATRPSATNSNTSTLTAASNQACGTDKKQDIEEEEEEMEQEEMFVEPHASFAVRIREWGGPKRGGRFLEPTRYGDWEKKGRCSDF